jgi:hypothetical protein
LDTFIASVAPTSPSEKRRRHVSDFVCDKIRNTLGKNSTIAFGVGSSALKTYLPDGDLDIAVFMPQIWAKPKGDSSGNTRQWFISLCEALCLEAVHSDRDGKGNTGGKQVRQAKEHLQCTVRNVTFVNAEVRIVKCLVDNIAIDITVNQTQSLDALVQFEEADRKFGQRHLFKRSVIVIKLWCLYESSKYAGQSILGAHNNGLSSYALQLMVLALFKTYKGSQSLTHPFQLLVLFFACYADFDWPNLAVTVDGPVPNSSLTPTSSPTGSPTNGSASKQGKDEVREFNLKPDPTRLQQGAVFPVRSMNVLDPMNANNNATRSVSPQGMDRLQRALQGGRRHLSAIVNTVYRNNKSQDVESTVGKAEAGAADMLFAFFSVTNQKYGKNNDGFRPDLLLHPCQHWMPPYSPHDGPCTLETDLNHLRKAQREALNVMDLKVEEVDAPITSGVIPTVAAGDVSTTSGSGKSISTSVIGTLQRVFFLIGLATMLALSVGTGAWLLHTARGNGSPFRCETDNETQTCRTMSDMVVLLKGVLPEDIGGADELPTVCKAAKMMPDGDENSLLTQWIRLGSAITFSFNALSISEAKFQWRLNGKPIHGATSSIYSVHQVGRMHSGTYTCVAYNSMGQVTQEEATLRISDLPTTESSMSVDSVVVGSLYSKEIHAEGLPSPKFQWRKNGVDLPGQVSSVLNIEKVGLDHAGTYTCKVYNVAGTTEWEELTLNVLSPA